MLEMSIFWLRVATVFYSIGVLHTILHVLGREKNLFQPARICVLIAAVLHLVAIVDRSIRVGHLPAANFYETLSLCGVLVALVFLFIDWRYRFSSLGVILFPLAFLMTAIAATEAPVTPFADARVRNALLLVHVLTILAGYVALLLTAAASIFYLAQERQLKRKSQGGLLHRLPPLGTLDELMTRSMAFGFVFLTAGMVVGSAWAFIETGTGWLGDAKIAISIFTWAFCLVMVFLRTIAGWRGRKAAVMAVGVLGCLALTWVAHAGLLGAIAR
ncbi:MAG: hypothetical protein FJW40_04270 [Acidobacteria bacterium]|nr:hypothetical protein [Acidobacteriota bacterium]